MMLINFWTPKYHCLKGDFVKYTIEGEIRFKGEARKFQKEVEAKSQKQATDKVYALMGSAYGIKRDRVKIISMKEVK